MSRPETRSLDDLLAMHDLLLPVAWRAALRAGAFLRDERPVDLRHRHQEHAHRRRVGHGPHRRGDDHRRPAGRAARRRAAGRGGRRAVGHLRRALGRRPAGRHRQLPVPAAHVGGLHRRRGRRGVRGGRGRMCPSSTRATSPSRGQGAWLVREGAGERLPGSDCATLAAALVATGFGYAAERRRRQAEVVTGLITQVSRRAPDGRGRRRLLLAGPRSRRRLLRDGAESVGHGRGRR